MEKQNREVVGPFTKWLLPSAVLLALCLAQTPGSLFAHWPPWGGPNGNFHVEASGLASSWAGAPSVLWSRTLGDGYSAISVVDGVLYTMYRQGSREVVLAADADTGETIWEYDYDATFHRHMKMENGSGPHATPLVTENGVYVIGILPVLRCLDKATGKVTWEHDLHEEFDAPVPDRGFSASPIPYRDTVIVKAGGAEHAVMAFRQIDGAVLWKSQSFKGSGSSPVLGNVDGFEQLVVFMGNEIAALNPVNGDLQWRHTHSTNWGLNLSTPIGGDDNIVFCSSAYGTGSRAILVKREDDHVVSEELWSTNQMRLHFTNAVRIGDYIYGSSGDFGPAPLTAIHARTGKIVWKDRTFAKANLIYAGGKLIVLDEDGKLALASVSPEGLKVLAMAALPDGRYWTVPTLAGTRLYVRNRRIMMALELGGES